MFFQFLRGRQYELLALRNASASLVRSGKVIPVIEPVTAELANLERAMAEMSGAGVPLAIITNPVANARRVHIGDVLQDASIEAALRTHALVIPSFMILVSTTPAQIQHFFTEYRGRDVCLVHYEAPASPATVTAVAARASAHPHHVTHVFEDRTPMSYRAAISGGRRILLRDGFRRQKNNASYAGEEFFSDLHLTCGANGYHGCADYSTVGDYFALGGGLPLAIAIHMTYQRDDGTIWVRHFLSDSNRTKANPGGKFLEAGRKVARFARAHPAFRATTGCQELLALVAAPHFPGLPKLKELSMRHHLELMASIV